MTHVAGEATVEEHLLVEAVQCLLDACSEVPE